MSTAGFVTRSALLVEVPKYESIIGFLHRCEAQEGVNP